jgi:hypothetical protein
MFAHDIQYSKPLTKECDIMPDHYYNHSRRNQRALSNSYNASAYPGLTPYAPSSLPAESGILPDLGAEAVTETALALPAAEATTKASGGLAGLLSGLGGGGGGGIAGNMEQIKGLIDRMGGIDGIVNSMGKVQKVMSGFQQMAPMVKLFMGSFGKGKGAAGALAAEEDAALFSPSRRKKRRSTSQRRKSSTTTRRRSTPSSGKRRRK